MTHKKHNQFIKKKPWWKATNLILTHYFRESSSLEVPPPAAAAALQEGPTPTRAPASGAGPLRGVALQPRLGGAETVV